MATLRRNGNEANGSSIRINGSQNVLAAGLRLLLCAHDYASHSDTDVWQFALEAEELRRAGLTNNEFRLLLVKGLVKQAQEITLPGDETRSFRLLGRFTLFPNSCFVLTDRGFRVARDMSHTEVQDSTPAIPAAGSDGGTRSPSAPLWENDHSPRLRPTWDSERKELRLGRAVVKVFKWPASNQEVILSVFEEEGWPGRIDNPLPISVEYDSKRRLHDTIKCLNRSQKNSLIHFRGDGTGEGVIWDFTHESRNQLTLRNGEHAYQLVESA